MGEGEGESEMGRGAADDDCEVMLEDTGVFELVVSVATLPDDAGCESVGVGGSVGLVGVEVRED